MLYEHTTFLVVGQPVQVRARITTRDVAVRTNHFIMAAINDKGEFFEGDIISTLQKYLLDTYQPVYDPLDAELHMTTQEIYFQLVQVAPTPDLTPAVVANWLIEGAFKFWDYGDMKFEWMMKKR